MKKYYFIFIDFLLSIISLILLFLIICNIKEKNEWKKYNKSIIESETYTIVDYQYFYDNYLLGSGNKADISYQSLTLKDNKENLIIINTKDLYDIKKIDNDIHKDCVVYVIFPDYNEYKRYIEKINSIIKYHIDYKKNVIIY